MLRPTKKNITFTRWKGLNDDLWSEIIAGYWFNRISWISLTEAFEAKVIELINEWNQLNGFMDNRKVIYRRIKLQFLTEIQHNEKTAHMAMHCSWNNPGNSAAIID